MATKKQADTSPLVPSAPVPLSPMVEMFRSDPGSFSPIFEGGASKEMGIERIEIERVHPPALAGWVGESNYQLTYQNIMILYGPGKYTLKAKGKGGVALGQTTVSIEGDRQEWQELRNAGKPKREEQGAADVIALMERLTRENNAALEKLRTESALAAASAQERQSEMLDRFTQMSIQQAQAERERLQMQIAAERAQAEERRRADREEFERQAARDSANRKHEMEMERTREDAARRRDMDYYTQMMQAQAAQANNQIDPLTLLTTIIPMIKGGDSDQGGSFWERLIVEGAPMILEKLTQKPELAQQMIQNLPPQQQHQIAGMIAGQMAPPPQPMPAQAPTRPPQPSQPQPPPPQPEAPKQPTGPKFDPMAAMKQTAPKTKE